MPQDSEQEVKLQFLEEAEEHLHTIESGVMGIGSGSVSRQTLDGVLRAAHSIKGGAAMMGFNTLSHLAHRAEDFFKVLTASQAAADGEVERALLTSVDRMHQVIGFDRRGETIAETWLSEQVVPIFDALHERLGDPKPEDEASLLGEDEGADMATMLFESEVGATLDRLAQVLEEPDPRCLAEEFDIAAQELGGLAEMLDMPAFNSLCQSVIVQIQAADAEQLVPVARMALQEWRRSQAMVLVGQAGAIPTTLDVSSLGLGSPPPIPSVGESDVATDLDPFASSFDLDLSGLELEEPEPVLADPSMVLPEAGSEFEADTAFDADLILGASVTDVAAPVAGVRLEDGGDLGWAIDALAIDLTEGHQETEPLMASQLELDAEPHHPEPLDVAAPPLTAEVLGADPTAELLELPEDLVDEASDLFAALDAADFGVMPSEPEPVQASRAAPVAPMRMEAASAAPAVPERTLRVSVGQLDRLGELFGELMIERNGLQLQLRRIRDLVELLQIRVTALDEANFELRSTYDQAATQQVVASGGALPEGAVDAAGGEPVMTEMLNLHNFDLLEMDRYSSMHLLSQELMDTSVQIREVGNDITLSLTEAEQKARRLTLTSQQLQSSVNQVRMRPIGDILGRFPRMLRDLSLEYGKQVKLEVIGGKTFVDRTILDALGDPLMHLLRNAFDHGIELPEARIAQGKPPQGTITIAARYRGNRTVITIQDDGGGINLDKLRQRALKMGLEESDLADATEADLLELIFEPGFSTAGQVTALSGRGVGMDVVRSNLEEIHGSITVQTEPGQGTTFTLSIPFTLSVVRVLLIESDNLVFAIPTDVVEEMTQLKPEDRCAHQGGEGLQWDDEVLPLRQLSEWLRFPQRPRLVDVDVAPLIEVPMALIVALEAEEWVAIAIDRFWGEQEVTIRQVEGDIPLPTGFAGCTILGDGRIVPLLDIQALANWMQGQPDESTPVPAADLASPADSSLSQLPLVMVVDDSINVRRFLALTLEKAGYQVEQAKDGQQALEKLQAGLPVQAIICDVEMPRLDGFGFLAQIMGKPEFKTIPVAMLTSRSGDKHRQLALNLGARAYFSKPFQEPELLATMAEFTQATALA